MIKFNLYLKGHRRYIVITINDKDISLDDIQNHVINCLKEKFIIFKTETDLLIVSSDEISNLHFQDLNTNKDLNITNDNDKDSNESSANEFDMSNVLDNISSSTSSDLKDSTNCNNNNEDSQDVIDE